MMTLPLATKESNRASREKTDGPEIPEIVPIKSVKEMSGAAQGKTVSGVKKKAPPSKFRFAFLSFSSGKQSRKKRKRFRPTPPGPRLVKALLMASVLLIVQALFRYPGIPVDLTAGQTREVTVPPPFELTSELADLSTKLSTLNNVKSITPGVFAVNLATGQYVDSNGKQAFSAASMIKIPILVSFLAAVERGACTMDDELEIRPDLITNGSGFLQWKPPGTKISARKAAQLMIVVSDNTATNLLIDLLGGFEHVNKDFHRWGLKQTKVNHLLADLEGTNTTCPYDLVYLLGRVDRGELVNKEHRFFMYEIMAKCKNRSMLPQGLDTGATIIHKTGTIGAMVGDAGIVTTPGGTRYAVSIQCARNRNDARASSLIREMSKMIYGTYALQAPHATESKDSRKSAKPQDKSRVFELAAQAEEKR